MNSGVYRIVHIANGKSYVGSTNGKNKRWSEHRKRLRANNHHSKHLQNAWNKHGEAAFAFEMIESIEDFSELIKREQFWIDSLHAYKSGYNGSPTAGSPRGFRHTAETRAKVSAAGRGRKLSPEHCALISARQKAKDISHLHTPETREVVAAKLRGRPQPEAVERLSKLRKGMKFPLEWRRAISIAMRGKKRGPLSSETRAKLSAINTGKSHSAEVRATLSALAKLRGAPKLTQEAIDRGAAKRTGAKRTPEQKERMRQGRLRAHERLATAA